MSLATVRQQLVARLDQGDRGDRGWFIITRVHVALAWLHGIAEYLEHRSGGKSIHLTDEDYRRLATITGINNPDPGVQLRRHHLLVMEKPLQLLHRLNANYWTDIELTERGMALAQSDDPATVLEQSLAAIQFAREPWTPNKRVQEYAGFNIRVYEVTRQVLARCDSYIDRNEFDFFLSRVRNDKEIDQAVQGIKDFRALTPSEQQSLHAEVRNRIPGDKEYQNWRDVGLHTFSLFALGTSMVREGQRLLLTAKWAQSHEAAAAVLIPGIERELRMPTPPEVESLLTPPAAPASNVGADGESFVAKVLRAEGWEVAFYTNRRGYGFDLWARRGRAAMVIEVKSSLGRLGGVVLTELEYKAAKTHGENFVLALVEDLDTDHPQLRMIQNPLAKLTPQRQETIGYAIARVDWLKAAAPGT